MRKLLGVIAATTVAFAAAPVVAGGQYNGTYGSGQVQGNTSGYYADNGQYRDRNGNMRDRYGNPVHERYAGTDTRGFYVDSRGALRDRRGRVVTNARAQQDGWFRDRRGAWVRGDADYAANGYYRDRQGVLRDRAGNRVDERYASSAGYNGQTWVGTDGRTYCRRSNGTTGLLIGGVAGALLGRAIDGGRNSAVGTILGGGAGALAGREIDRSQSECR